MNKVILLGNVGQTPDDLRQAGEYKVLKISLATTSGYGDKKTTDWHTLELWNKAAEIVHKYVKKGDKLMVEGRIKYDQYEKDGITKYSTKIVVDTFELLGGRKDEAQEAKPAIGQPPVGYNPFANTPPASPANGDLPF